MPSSADHKRSSSWFGRSKSKRDPDFYKKAAAEEKKHKRKSSMTTADPTRAITELQPWEVNQQHVTKSLGAFQYKDIYGRPIAEPDLSNPTRSRWERPLDTIRSFQDSIDKGYRRQSYYTDEPTSPSESNWGPRNHARPQAAAEQDSANLSTMYNRAQNSTTPLSAASAGEQEAFGMMGGRTALNEHVVPGMQASRPRNNSGPPDTGYGSIDRPQGDPAYSWGRQAQSPLQNQVSPSESTPRSAMPMQLNSAPGPVEIKGKEKEKEKKKGWLGKRLSKNK